MNNEIMSNMIIPISPIVDKTDEAYFLSGTKKRARKTVTSKFIKRLICLCLSMHFVLCSVFFVGNEQTKMIIKNKIIYGVLYGGYLKAPIQKNESSDESIPTSSEPDLSDNVSDSDSKNDILDAFIKLYEYDLSLVPDELYPIIPYDLSQENDGELRLFNDTTLKVDINALSETDNTVEATSYSEEPSVLIIHTHGTEAYSEEGALGYSNFYNIPRSYDVTKNVIAVGRHMAKVLNESGVNAIQCDIMHDAESYLGAYDRSEETIKRYLKAYPTIKYVFDIHRDSVLLEDKTKTRPVTIADGKIAAQIMTVAGSNELGTYHPSWEKNLVFASKLQKNLNENHLGLARSICLRGTTYNQELAPCSLLFEIGSCGNTLSEALVSAELLAIELSRIIKSGW